MKPRERLSSITSIISVIQSIVDTEQDASQNASADNIIQQMRQNSQAWNYSSDEERAALHQANEQLAEDYRVATGENIYYDSGAWYHEDGTRLYSTNTLQIGNIVERMRQNSAVWRGSSSTERDRLSSENEKLAAEIQEMLGERVYKDSNGVWWVGSRKLYDVYNSGTLSGSSVSHNKSSGTFDAVKEMLESVSMDIPSNPAEFIKGKIPTPTKAASSVNNVQNEVTMSLVLPNVKNYDEFVNALRDDKKFEKMIQTITIEQLNGKSSLNKNKYQW